MSSPQNGFTSPTSPVAASGDVLLDSLTADYKIGGALGTGAVLTYSFPWATSATAVWASNPSYSPLNEPAAGFALNPMQQAAFRAALASWSAVANIRFVEVPDTPDSVGDIRVAWTGMASPPSDAWTWQSSDYWANAGDIWLSDALMGGQPDADWRGGGFNFMSLIHELGHALWLDHPFDGPNPMPATYDSQQYTLMSYIEHPHYLFVRYHPAVTEADGSVTVSWDVVPVYPSTPMMLDIAAVQRLYGANMNWHAGNDVYTFDPDSPFIMTLWDGGGVDTISASNFDTDCQIDLCAGHFSSLPIRSDSAITGFPDAPLVPALSLDYDGTDNLGIAWGAVIENAVGGMGNDTLLGNDVNNVLRGNAGNDVLDGGGGTDTALFDFAYSRQSIARAGGTVIVSGPDGEDTLTHIERLQFSDHGLALDLDPAQSAGKSILLLGAVLPGLLALDPSKEALVGNVIDLFDAGFTVQDLSGAILRLPIWDVLTGKAKPANIDIANYILGNVYGHAPTSVEVDSAARALATETFQGDWLASVVVGVANQHHIGLPDLQQTGLLFA